MISDIVIVSIVTTIGMVITAMINKSGLKVVSGKVDQVKHQTDGLVEKLLDAKDATIVDKEAISKAQGNKEGIAEKQKEIDQINKDSTPK